MSGLGLGLVGSGLGLGLVGLGLGFGLGLVRYGLGLGLAGSGLVNNTAYMYMHDCGKWLIIMIGRSSKFITEG